MGLTHTYCLGDGANATLEERVLRAEFQAEHAPYIPEDFCLYVENPPNCWSISTSNNEPLETLPVIENDVIQIVSTPPLLQLVVFKLMWVG